MIKNALVLFFFCAFLAEAAFCMENREIGSEVISINSEKEYIIIKAGESEGVEIGDGLIVYRDAEKLAEAQVIEVRPDVAAAEILSSEKEIKEGDSVLIVKQAGPAYREPKKSKWTILLGSNAAVKSKMLAAGGIVKTDIGADLNTVFSYSLMVLRENGYSVVFSNRATGNILATMPIELGLIKELWADATASIEHKLAVTLEIKDNNGISELSISSFKEHTQKKKQVKFPVTKGSKYYNLLAGLASKIKERATH